MHCEEQGSVMPSRTKLATKTSNNFITPPDVSFKQTSVLMRAIHFEDIRQIRLLLKKGCSPNKAVGDRQIRSLMMACYVKNTNKRIAIFKSLLRYGVEPALTDIDGQNSLMYACALGLNDEVKLILENTMYSFYNADIHGNTLLHICAMYSSVDVMDMVLTKMFTYLMNINIRNNMNHTPLDAAIMHENVDCTEKLYEVGGQSTCTLPMFKRKSLYFPELLKIRSSDIRQEDEDWSDTMLMTIDPLKRSCSLCSTPTIKQTPRKSTSLNESLPKIPIKVERISVPRKDTEEILHQLLELKGKRNTSTYCRPSKEKAPLNSEWVSTMQAYLARADQLPHKSITIHSVELALNSKKSKRSAT